jgi:hypothetical protein
MADEKAARPQQKLSVRATPGETKIGDIRLTLEGDPVLRGSIEGFHSRLDSMLRDQLATLSCCFEGCCVSFCCVRIT